MTSTKLSNRLLSLDFLRGLIMVLLAFESAGLYRALNYSAGDAIPFILKQFEHHPWHGLRFWDLIQPGFMFIAGTSMAFSLAKQRRLGMTWKQSFWKTLKRSGWLLFWGVLINAVRPKGLFFMFTNVLAQLSFTTLLTFLIFRWKIPYQLLFCLGLLVLTEMLYRLTNIPGFNQPFIDKHNFGNYVDTLLIGKITPRGWVTLNCIPTAVHTILGAVAGKILLSERATNKKLILLLTGGLICLFLGYTLDIAGITPIIKRIATTSFTLAAGGWCLLALLCCYWWIDVKDHRQHLAFFTIVGANSLAIYLFFEIVGHKWFNQYIGIITSDLMSRVNIPHAAQLLITALCVFFLEWRFCYFLYKKNVFFKI